MRCWRDIGFAARDNSLMDFTLDHYLFEFGFLPPSGDISLPTASQNTPLLAVGYFLEKAAKR